MINSIAYSRKFRSIILSFIIGLFFSIPTFLHPFLNKHSRVTYHPARPTWYRSDITSMDIYAAADQEKIRLTFRNLKEKDNSFSFAKAKVINDYVIGESNDFLVIAKCSKEQTILKKFENKEQWLKELEVLKVNSNELLEQYNFFIDIPDIKSAWYTWKRDWWFYVPLSILSLLFVSAIAFIPSFIICSLPWWKHLGKISEEEYFKKHKKKETEKNSSEKNSNANIYEQIEKLKTVKNEIDHKH